MISTFFGILVGVRSCPLIMSVCTFLTIWTSAGGGGGGGGGGGATSAIISCAFGSASVNSNGISTKTPITIASRMNEIVVVLPRLVLSLLPDSIKLSSNIVFSRHRATVL